jgi:hypothetical protein
LSLGFDILGMGIGNDYSGNTCRRHADRTQ